MKIAVVVKQTPDTETQAKLNDTGLDAQGVKFILNPYDEFAVEEAIKSKEKMSAELSVISLGPDRTVEAMRTALAMGCDTGVHVKCDESDVNKFDSYLTAKTLAHALKEKGPFNLVFCGKQAIDDDAAAVPQMLAEFLDIPRVTVASDFELQEDKATVKRSVEGGAEEVVEVTLPCLVSANKGLNKPRYASLPGIMKAKQKKIDVINFADTGLTTDNAKIKPKGFELPPEKAAGQKFTGTPEELAKQIVNALKNEAKVI